MEDKLIMSKKELNRKSILDAYFYKKFTLKEASGRMGLGYRQGKRISKKYKELGDQGLIHGHRGRVSPNKHEKDFKERILTIYKAKYLDFGPTFASEKLGEDDHIFIHRETLRLWLKAEGLWNRKRKRKVYRERRERRPCFGELLQIDGSIHRWFENDENYYCLLNIVDDATGVTFALLDKGETTKLLLTTFRKWVEKYGIPKAVYVDLKSVYVSPKYLKEKYDDDLLIKEGFSVFEKVCKELNIEIIRAYSPEAKGRVERKHKVFQDRFAKDLKLYRIKAITDANNYLESTFLKKINEKFAKEPAEKRDMHRDPKIYNLEQIFCWRYKRQLRNDWTIQFKREYFQIEKGYEKIITPEIFIIIKIYLNGTMKFWFNEYELHYRLLSQKPEPLSKQKQYRKLKGPADPILISKRSKKNKHLSPWSTFNPDWLKSA